MDIRRLQRVVVEALEDNKAQNINVFNTSGLSDMFDRVVVATGTSNRQTRALAYHVVQKVKEAGGRVVSVEGAEVGEWVLVDLGEIVVHVMQPQVRAYYALEELWGAKPVALKRAEPAVKRVARKAAGTEAGQGRSASKTAARKNATRKTASARTGKARASGVSRRRSDA
ncbi:MAG: ribosome silencing factor [Sutterellaceae bacterium]|nr:ribosome silencing factor [Burkholderiaceae bacterium]MCX7902551.1 ribosome silencing factor [Burkholderiaceae bacterium]MDW8428923.1 ribosome silencing factor [Sutterellaceae bacterium]